MSTESEVVSTSVADGTINVSVNTDMTIYTAGQLFEELLEKWKSITEMPEVFEIDLSDVGEFDSAGFQMLSLFKRECESKQCKFRLAHVSESIEDALTILGSKEHFVVR